MGRVSDISDIKLALDEVAAIRAEACDARIRALCDDWVEFAKRLESVGTAARVLSDVAELRRQKLLEILDILSSDYDSARANKKAKEKLEGYFSPASSQGRS
jgi:hypothetical protein